MAELAGRKIPLDIAFNKSDIRAPEPVLAAKLARSVVAETPPNVSLASVFILMARAKGDRWPVNVGVDEGR